MGLFLDDEVVDTRSSHTLWVEKYRPQKLDEYVGSETLKNSFTSYVQSNDIPHLLLYGGAGVGKTTFAKMISKSIDCDLLYINASDERKVDELGARIKGFASSVCVRKLKVIILDEVDYISAHAQALLRNMLEMYSYSTRFILTCNYPEKIIAPVVSRCQVFEVVPPSKKDIAIHLTNVLRKENVTYEKESVAFLVNSYYPDIRRILNTAQQGSLSGKLEVNQKAVIENDVKLKVVDLLKNSVSGKDTFTKIRQLISDNKTTDYTEFYSTLFSHSDEYSKNQLANIIVTIAESQYQAALVVDKEISFMSCIVQLLKLIHSKES